MPTSDGSLIAGHTDHELEVLLSLEVDPDCPLLVDPRHRCANADGRFRPGSTCDLGARVAVRRAS